MKFRSRREKKKRIQNITSRENFERKREREFEQQLRGDVIIQTLLGNQSRFEIQRRNSVDANTDVPRGINDEDASVGRYERRRVGKVTVRVAFDFYERIFLIPALLYIVRAANVKTERSSFRFDGLSARTTRSFTSPFAVVYTKLSTFALTFEFGLGRFGMGSGVLQYC